jgi:hypothetical protein
MKLIAAVISVLALSGTLALAQGGGSSGGAGGGGSAGGGSPGAAGTAPSGAPQSSGGITGPSISAPNGLTTPSPSDPATTGRGPGVNPSNPQDQTQRGNPQDLSRPGGRNPQDLNQVAPGVPNIIAPEK